MDKTIIEQIVDAIADAEETQPENLSVTLHQHVATDAIRMLENHPSDSWRLQFETPRHVVTVIGNNAIFVDGEEIRPFSRES